MTNSKEDLDASIEVAKDMGWFGWGKKPAIWDAMAFNVLQKDLGEFEDSTTIDYGLDESTRDRLIAHARQDAAMAFYAAQAAYREAANARLLSWLSFILLLVILYKVW
jgi:hypothetical protein